MGKQKQRLRIWCKIDELPDNIKSQVEAMIADTRNSYVFISQWLNNQGYEISKSSVGRYAGRLNGTVQRLIEAQEQTRVIVEAIKKNPEADYTEGALQIMSGELTKKFAAAQDEWDDMPLDKAARAMIALSRTKIYKDKIKADLTEKMKGALEQFKREVYAEIKDVEPELYEKLSEVADRVAGRLVSEE